MVVLRPSWLGRLPLSAIPVVSDNPGFICHPSTSELASQLLIDPTALNNENYSGIYDENGDYIPMYCDDPEKVPQSAMKPNSDSAAASNSPGTSEVNNSEPASIPAESSPAPTE